MTFRHSDTYYDFIKWSMEREEKFPKGRNDIDIPISRYAEVLLNYAEAKVEPGQNPGGRSNGLTQSIEGVHLRGTLAFFKNIKCFQV